MTRKLFFCLLAVYMCKDGVCGLREKRKTCSLNICQLQSPCANGATCVWNDTVCRLSCVCRPGFTGSSCETNIETTVDTTVKPTPVPNTNVTPCAVDPCLANSPCLNNGSCTVNPASCTPFCFCTSGFKDPTCNETLGSNCDLIPNFCQLQNPCQNGGSCVRNSTCHIHCECTEEYTGDSCQVSVSATTTRTVTTTPSLRPLHERECGFGFTCVYGKCEKEGKGVKCKCDHGHIGTFCTIPCSLQCGKGECDIRNGTERCSCPYPYHGLGCTEIYVEKSQVLYNDSWKYWVIGSCVLLFILLALLFIPAYILMRRRNIFIMRILYYFQPYEDDDGKQFDAFISYKSCPEDEDFVYRTLYPELEKKRGFHLCLHQRDFVPGETIANNILWAVESSRRTILVLSPRYLESDFTRFEFQVAHDEMLKQKHKVIPLLLEDISEQSHLMDRTLTSIIKSITYIEWPVERIEEQLEKFWSRIELSLPKKRTQSEDKSLGSISTNSTEIPYTISLGNYDTGVELTSISHEETDKSSDAHRDDLSKSQLSSLRSDPDKVSESMLNEDKPLNKSQLKDFFNEPINDEVFNRMREQSMELETCLNV